MEREGRGRRREGEMKRRGRREVGGEKMRGIVIGGMVLGLLLGCNNGIAELEKKSSFYESVVKIGQGFQEIFGNFGNAFGDKLGFNAVKSGDNKSEVGKHFDKIGNGLKGTKDRLDDLVKKISSVSHSDTTGVETVIKNASEVITKLIASVTKLTGVTKDVNVVIGDTASGAAVEADQNSVDTVIEGIKDIIETAQEFGMTIEQGTYGVAGKAGATTDATAVLNSNSRATGNSGPNLVAEVSKADPWAMIAKIKNATKTGKNEAIQLAISAPSQANGIQAATNADFAAAVALKAIAKSGKFSAHSGEEDVIKVAAVSAVNKVLGVLDEIIRRTVTKNLEKVREAVKEIKYSDTDGEAIEAKK